MSFLDNVSVENSKSVLESIFQHSFIKSSISIVLLMYSWVFGDKNSTHPLLAIYLLITFDTATGFLKASKNKNLSSSVFFRVVVKFFLYTLMIVGCRLVDKILSVPFISVINEAFLAITELISIFENSHALGVPLPKKLVTLLKERVE